MRTKFKKIIFAFLILLPVCAFATNITFTSSGSIVDGNVFDEVYVRNNGTVVNMSGGQINYELYTYDASTFNMSAGVITGAVYISNLGTFNISSGTIDAGFVVKGSANLSGGNITADGLKTYPDSVVNITGGNLSFGLFDIRGEVNIYRGLLNVDNAYIAYQGFGLANINIYGSGFNYNPSTQILTVYLLDTNPFTMTGIDASEYTRFNLVPEPISLLFFGFGLLALRKHN